MRPTWMQDARSWAANVFGDAELGDARRTRRLVALAEEAAARPAGVVMTTCTTSASREGAFRFLENKTVRPDAVREAMCHATARSCRAEKTVIVPVDATSLHLTDRTRKRGIGGIGTWSKGAQGIHVMTALALTSEGTTLGIVDQQMWVRTKRSKHGRSGTLGRPGANENQVWLDVMEGVVGTLEEEAPDCRPWFQLDRGGDSVQVLQLGKERGLLMTVRSAYDRLLEDESKLWATLEKMPIVAKKPIAISRQPPRDRQKRVNGKRVQFKTKPRAARQATVAIRAASITLDCRPQGKRNQPNPIEVNAVYVREMNRSAEDRIEWMLLTTHPIRTPKDVLDVVRGYTLRWRIEEFHRVWKTGLCNVEDTQLRSRDAIFKWSTILAAVATRAMRLTQLARTTPDVPATTEFSATELAAIIALRKPKGINEGHVPTLAVAVRWLAEVGGHSGPSKGAPGAITVGRGLYDVLVVARAFENRDQKR